MRQYKKITALKIPEGVLRGFVSAFTTFLAAQLFRFFYWLFFGVSLPWWEVYIVQILCFPLFAIGIVAYLSVSHEIKPIDRESDTQP